MRQLRQNISNLDRSRRARNANESRRTRRQYDCIGTNSILGLDERVHAKIDGENCYGPAKLRMIEEWLGKAGLTRGRVRFYSDHASDAPVFEWSDEPVAVNPHDRLAKLAAARGWRVEDWG